MSLEVLELSGCCGLREITYLADHARDPEDAARAFAADVEYDKNFRYAIFTQAGVRSTYGVKFAAFILANGLGEVVETGWNTNPNTGSRLKVWVWTVNHRKLQKLYGGQNG